MSVRLVVLTAGRWRGQSILVKRFPVLIGQEPGCHLRLTAPLIGDRHCALWTQDGKIYVRDLTRASGTFLNGQRITEDTPISHSDCLRIGPVEFDVRIEGSPSIDEATPLPPPSGLALPGEEEDVAAILLAIQDAPAPISSTITIENRDVAEGSSAPGLLQPDQAPEPGSEKAKSPAPARPPVDTPKAATNLLHKYLRRSPL
jgi:predicted component of type VI protein secretion system